MAFAKWWFPHSLTPAQQAEEEYEESNPEALPPGFNVALCEDFDRQLVGGRKKWIIKSDMYCKLHSPSHLVDGQGKNFTGLLILRLKS